MQEASVKWRKWPSVDNAVKMVGALADGVNSPVALSSFVMSRALLPIRPDDDCCQIRDWRGDFKPSPSGKPLRSVGNWLQRGCGCYSGADAAMAGQGRTV